MKLFNEILEDRDYILSEEKKFEERGNNISYIKRNEMEEYYNAFKHEKALLEDGEYAFCGASQEVIDRQWEKIHEIEESGIEFALRRMTNIISFDEHSIYDIVYFIERSNDDNNCYFRMLDLVHLVNAYWDITDEKPANRVAWGWNQCHKKESKMGYLYGCVRNYLKRNGKWDKDQFNRIWFGRLP